MNDEAAHHLPVVDNESEEWWKALAERKLLFRRCAQCGHDYLYPRDFCPKCWSTDVGWVQASGRGQLYTYSVIYFNDLEPFSEWLPYVAAMVDLDEGPRMATNVVDCDRDDLRVGMALEVCFREIDGVTVPFFTPIATGH